MAHANLNDLMISISGVRGIVGRSLTPELLVRLRVPNPEEFDVRRLDALVEMAKPAHVPHRVEVSG